MFSLGFLFLICATDTWLFDFGHLATLDCILSHFFLHFCTWLNSASLGFASNLYLNLCLISFSKILKHRKNFEIPDFIDFFHNNFCTFYHLHMAINPLFIRYRYSLNAFKTSFSLPLYPSFYLLIPRSRYLKRYLKNEIIVVLI